MALNTKIFAIILMAFLSEAGTNLYVSAQESEVPLTIEIIQQGAGIKPAAWVTIQSEASDNIAGWYQQKGPKGFPVLSSATVNVPPGLITIKAWNSSSDEVIKKLEVRPNTPSVCKIVLTTRFDRRKEGYYAFDSHNHLDGDKEKNCPPYIFPYAAALGIDRIDVCQLWFSELGKPVSYDSIVKLLSANSTPELNLQFGVESPKLRYGHTWYVNHPGLQDPLGDYLKWHDVDYYDMLNSAINKIPDSVDLRGTYYSKWNPPFVDRLNYRAKGAFSVAAHPTRWWHQRPDKNFPATNVAADLVFDLLTAQSYDGLVVLGDCKDNIFNQSLWFNLLNRGYRLVPVAETDGNIANGSFGHLAVTYVRTGKEEFDNRSFVENLKEGHTMLSGKATMFLTVDGVYPPGTVLTADNKDHSIKVKVFSEPLSDEYVSYLVLYHNGKVADIADFREQKKREIEHTFTVSDTETAWYVVKSYGKNYPKEELQFDVLAYSDHCKRTPDNDYEKFTGISFTAPVFFDAPGWKAPEPLKSRIHGKIMDENGRPLGNLPVEIWNINDKLAELTTDDQGNFKIEAPATIDIRFTLPDGRTQQQWLFYEYPPLLDLIEDTYTISWAKRFPNLQSGQMPWEAFHFDELKETLKEIRWNVYPSKKEILSHIDISNNH